MNYATVLFFEVGFICPGTAVNAIACVATNEAVPKTQQHKKKKM
jgi:hypothetical protein